MVLTNEMVILLALGLMNYQLLWKRGFIQKLAGDLMFFFLSISTYLVVSAPVTDWPWGVIGAIIAIGSFVTTLRDI